jgi:hypothetical protein
MVMVTGSQFSNSWSDGYADGADKAGTGADAWTLGVLGSDGCAPMRTGVCRQVLSSNRKGGQSRGDRGHRL